MAHHRAPLCSTDTERFHEGLRRHENLSPRSAPFTPTRVTYSPQGTTTNRFQPLKMNSTSPASRHNLSVYIGPVCRRNVMSSPHNSDIYSFLAIFHISYMNFTFSAPLQPDTIACPLRNAQCLVKNHQRLLQHQRNDTHNHHNSVFKASSIHSWED